MHVDRPCVNAASPYGGDRSGPLVAGPPAQRGDSDAFEPWAAAPARAAFMFLSTAGSFLLAQGGPATVIQVTGGSAPAGHARAWPVGGGLLRRPCADERGGARASGARHPCGAPDRRRRIEPLAGAPPASRSRRSPTLARSRRRSVPRQQGARSATHELQVTRSPSAGCPDRRARPVGMCRRRAA